MHGKRTRVSDGVGNRGSGREYNNQPLSGIDSGENAVCGSRDSGGGGDDDEDGGGGDCNSNSQQRRRWQWRRRWRRMSGCFVLINFPLRRQPKLEFLMTYVMVKYNT